jgi:hypothetical protein
MPLLTARLRRWSSVPRPCPHSCGPSNPLRCPEGYTSLSLFRHLSTIPISAQPDMEAATRPIIHGLYDILPPETNVPFNFPLIMGALISRP